MFDSIDQARAYNQKAQYNSAIKSLDHFIDSDANEYEKASAFLLRGKTYINLKEYRYAYRDLQVAWKLSCHIYQNENNSTPTEMNDYDPAKACIEQIPILIDNLKPFISEFGAIMSTQEASALVKIIFPEISR
ncbi:tetratricopeptide repeat protein [Maridesulfovibrio zosterae]|uniref:tetratricopeptide repeat protein n=1 Tax=Maridesulfovibrio zosterae TaxID=82171 RepID=UPI0003FEBCB2|nr:hypothetical protein [Maridesulfovibrio zosterae]